MEKIIIEIVSDNTVISKSEYAGRKDGTPNVSDYARFFNESCANWTKNPEYNFHFLKQQEMYATSVLKSRGYLFLNDVYDMLGIPRSKAGQVVGWVYDPDNTAGDNYVDFDLYSSQNEGFVNGYEKSALLDFNVDGCILDRI